jgi:hypothetical protein
VSSKRLGAARVLDADAPGLPVGARSDDLDVTAEIDHAVVQAAFVAQRGGAVYRVLLHDTAEVELEAGLGKRQAWRLPAQAMPADARLQRGDSRGIGQPP